jgi:transcriptional regulator with XRE-family HTH domain
MTTHVADQGRHYEFGLPDRLRAAREQAGLSQFALAAITGISLKSITRYETGGTVPRRPQLVVWALATGFDLEWLESGKVASSPDNGDGIPVTRQKYGIPTWSVIGVLPPLWESHRSVAMLPIAA